MGEMKKALLSSKMDLSNLTPEQIAGKKILMRVDFNVPLDKSTGVIKDDTRIKAALPTITSILAGNPRQLTLMSHLGRPDGRPQADKFSLAPVVPKLEELLAAAGM